MLGAFTDQAYNLILLAEDEARMLGRAEVEPEHVLLALSRYGNVESLLAERAISGRDIYGAIVRASGLGPDLVLGPVPRSKATDDALERAVEAAARRGIRAPSSEHVLLGLSQDPSVNALVRELGIHDVERLVDARYPVRRAPLSLEEAKSYALRVGTKRAPPSPGPIPPLFERFTTSARSAVAAGERIAAELMHEYVAPFHLLLGLLRPEGSLAGDVLRRHNLDADQAIRRAQLLGPGRSHQTTGIFTHEARRIVAEDALRYVNLHGHGSIGTGHVLLATLATDGVVTKLLGEERVAGAVATEIVDRLPGDEDSNTGLHDHT